MGCTTILVGKNASFDGSTMVARTEDAPSGVFRAKKFINVAPEEQPRKYKSVAVGTHPSQVPVIPRKKILHQAKFYSSQI